MTHISVLQICLLSFRILPYFFSLSGFTLSVFLFMPLIYIFMPSFCLGKWIFDAKWYYSLSAVDSKWCWSKWNLFFTKDLSTIPSVCCIDPVNIIAHVEIWSPSLLSNFNGAGEEEVKSGELCSIAV